MTDATKFITEANAAAMQTKARLQQEAQRKRVKDLAAEVRERLDALNEKTHTVSYALREIENGSTYYTRGYPAGAFQHDTASLDDLLAALHKEVEHLHGLIRAEEEATALSEQFGARASELFGDAEPGVGSSVHPMAGGAYL